MEIKVIKTVKFIDAMLCLVIVGFASCIKQSSCNDCDNYSEGTLVVFKEPYHDARYNETYCAKFFPDMSIDSDFEGIGILNSLPNRYKKLDTVIVGIGYTSKNYPMNRIPAWEVKCIEQIDNFKK